VLWPSSNASLQTATAFVRDVKTLSDNKNKPRVKE
jgi:hypothetical protein